MVAWKVRAPKDPSLAEARSATFGIEENASMAEARRVRLYWDDGTVETPHHPIDAGVTMIIRQAKDGTHRHFEVTDGIDADGYIIALELPDEP